MRSREMMGIRVYSLGLSSPLSRYNIWVYYNKVPIYPIFYLLKGDYRSWRSKKDADTARES